MGLLSTIGAASGRAFGLTRVGAAIRDAYFNLTTLLLPGNGTNGAQNNTFLDSSSNNFTITRNGNTTQGTFSPFSQTGWSNFFDGTGDYLSLTIGSTTIGSGDFTIEFWYYPTAFQNFDTMFSTTRGANGFNIGTNASASVVWYSSSAEQINSGTLTQNAWNHIAFTRTSNTLRLYLNGSQTGATPTVSTNFSATSCWIGDLATSGGEPSQGYISNLRIVTQSLASGSTYTVSTTPLTAIANTSLLTCQSNRFIDNSSNAFAITRNGDVSVQAFSPFAPTAAYSAATVGGSGYFDGTGDYLTIPDNAAFDLGTGDFTFECWVYKPNNAEVSFLCSGATGLDFAYVTAGGDTLRFGRYPVAWDTQLSYSIPQNAWTHIAFVKASGRVYFFANGTLLNAGGTANTNSYDTTTTLNVGVAGDGNRPLNGYMTGVRLIKGQALATASFTPPTAPVTTSSVGWTGAASSITGTVSLLLNFTNAGITDATAKNVLETVGNAQISTTQSKFGGSSMYFDGTGDWCLVRNDQNFNMGSGDFTIEFWAYTTSRSSSGTCWVSKWGSTATSARSWIPAFTTSTGKLEFYISTDGSGSTAVVSATYTPSLNAWNHYAITRSGSTFRFFVNGDLIGSGTNTGTLFSADEPLCVGANYEDVQGGVSNYNNIGYIDDLRITKGYARYVEGTGGNASKMVFNGTNNLALPSAAFPTQ